MQEEVCRFGLGVISSRLLTGSATTPRHPYYLRSTHSTVRSDPSVFYYFQVPNTFILEI